MNGAETVAFDFAHGEMLETMALGDFTVTYKLDSHIFSSWISEKWSLNPSKNKKISQCWSLGHPRLPQIYVGRGEHHNANNSWLLENDLLRNNPRRFWYSPDAYSPH